jgi:hypothetical protein
MQPRRPRRPDVFVRRRVCGVFHRLAQRDEAVPAPLQAREQRVERVSVQLVRVDQQDLREVAAEVFLRQRLDQSSIVSL